MSKLASVYGVSLFELTLAQNNDETVLNQIKVLQTVIAENENFIRVLSAPMIEKDEKLKIVDAALKGKVETSLLNYIKVMVERKDAAVLSDSLKEYIKLYNTHYNIEVATAITAIPLTDKMQANLVAKLEAITGKTIVLDNKIDASCIGGIILSLSDTQIDDSIKQKLSTLKKQLTSTAN